MLMTDECESNEEWRMLNAFEDPNDRVAALTALDAIRITLRCDIAPRLSAGSERQDHILTDNRSLLTH